MARARRFDLFTASAPLRSESGNGEWWVRHEIYARDWRPARHDLSRTDVRALARLPVGGAMYLGGGAAPEFFVRRTQ